MIDTICHYWPLLVNGPNFYAAIGCIIALELWALAEQPAKDVRL